MHVRKIDLKTIWICLLMLIYLAGLMPPARVVAASPAAAAAVPAAGSCAAGAVAAEVPVVIASPDQQVTIPKKKVDSSVYAAKWAFHFREGAAVESVMRQWFISEVPSGATELLFELFDKAEIAIPRAQIDDKIKFPHDAIIHTYLDLALAMPDLAPYVPIIWDRINADVPIAGLAVESPLLIAQSAQRYDLAARMLARAPQLVIHVRECAQRDNSVAGLLDAILKPVLGVSVLDSAAKILENDSDLMVPQEIRDNIQPDGTLNITLNDLKALSETEFGKVHASIADIRKTILDIDERQKVITDYLSNQIEKARMAELAKQKDEENQLRLDAAKSSLFIISTIAKQIDPKVGKSIETVGGAAIQVGVALKGWLKATAGLGALDKVFSLSTVVMTGNVLGAVMNVTSLFGEAQPNLDKMILKEIGLLREQIDALRQEMHGRFDRIDAELNAIYASMHDRFSQIDIQLGRINGNIVELQRSLLALELRLSRIERNNFEFLNALGRRPLLDAINGGLGYEARTGQPLPFEPQFVEFENVLHGWATIHAFDALNAGPTQRDYSDGQVLAELAAFPLDSNLNYLNGWLQAHGLPAIANKRLASPRDWLFAARAYTQLGMENPAHMARINPQRQAALDEVGAALEAALTGLSTLPAAADNGAGAQGNSLLFTAVLTHYEGKLGALDTALQSMENAFVEEVRAVRLQRAAPFGLYQGIDQELPFLADGFKQLLPGNGGEPLAAPTNLVARLAALHRYNLAEYFALDGEPQARVYVDGIVSNRRPLPGCVPQPDICPVIGDLRIITLVRYGNVPLLRMEAPAGRVRLEVIAGDLESATAYVVRNWGSLKGVFEANAVEVPLAPEAEAERAAHYLALGEELEQRLAAYQQELYGRVLNALSTGPLKPLALDLAGAKALVEAFTTLGLPRAVAQDEFLHALLFGNQQLVGDSEILHSYAISVTQPITGAALLVSPRTLVQEAANARADAVGTLIGDYLDAIGAGEYAEQADAITNTRRALDLTVRIAQLLDAEPPVPPTPPVTPKPPGIPPDATNKTYLPLVGK